CPTVASWFSRRCEASSGHGAPDSASALPGERLVTMRIEYSTPQNMQPGRAVLSLALSRSRVECCRQHDKNPRELECPPCNRFPAKATPQVAKPTMSSWSAPVLPACTCFTGCARWD